MLFLCKINCSAQTKLELRYEIDAKRTGINYDSEDALPRSREFKKLDSTYYVGWMFEGTYRYERAADYLGFKLAAEQLDKAFKLLIKDYKNKIIPHSSDYGLYFENYSFHRDYDYIAYLLMNCYSNMEKPEKVWQHLSLCKTINLQDEYYLETYNMLAWTVHRNRTFTKNKYSFLKNSIEENEKYAHHLLDKALQKIKADAVFNDALFNENYSLNKSYSVNHYRAILYSYDQKISKAAIEYDILKKTSLFPASNYATFCLIQGKFKDAQFYYNMASQQEIADKRMKEHIYYLSILDSYNGNNKKSIEKLQQVINANGTTPGFGWYNISLARNLIYDGQTEIAKKINDRAEQFQEIHRGTTLGKNHYDFTVAINKLQLKNQEIAKIKYLNSYWWLNFNNIIDVLFLNIEKYSQQFLLINQLALNPEREEVTYKIFSTESTISFDEVWTLIKDFSTNYFIKKYENFIKKDTRQNVKHYYYYYIAQLYFKKNKPEETIKYLNLVKKDAYLEKENEKLLLAKIALLEAQCYKKLDDKNAMENSICNAYQLYPQLLPYSGIATPIYLTTNAVNKNETKIISKIKSTKNNFLNEKQQNCIEVDINFIYKNNIKYIELNTSCKRIKKVSQLQIAYKDEKTAAKEIALYMFNIGNLEKKINMN